MTDYSPLDNSSEKLFETTLRKVKRQLEVKSKDTTVGLKLLTRFDELKTYRGLFVHKVTELKGRSGSFIIMLIEKHQTIIQHRKNAHVEKEIEEIEPILIFNIPQDVGRVYIRKETIGDKITDLLIKVDIDFSDYPNFSKNYYVVGENPELIRRNLPKRFIESLDEIEGMTIEINGTTGLLRTEKNLTENVLSSLINIGYKMVN